MMQQIGLGFALGIITVECGTSIYYLLTTTEGAVARTVYIIGIPIRLLACWSLFTILFQGVS